MTDESKDYYFTFGFGHVDPGSGLSLANCYTVIRGTFNSARDEMVARYGNKWAFQYGSAEEAGVERWGLRRV